MKLLYILCTTLYMVYSRAKVLEQYAMIGASLYPHTLQQHYVVVG